MSQPGLRPTADDVAPIQLARPELDKATVEKLYLTRRSHREFASEPIPLADFSRLLSCLAQLHLDHLTTEGSPLPKYRYASAGSLYPIQIYFYVKPERIEGIPAGTYYYHPVEHHLVPLQPDAHIDPQMHAPVNRAIWGGSAFSIFLVAQMRAIQPIYGEASQRYAMLEAGAISQLLETSAPEHHIGLCQIGELDSAALRPLLALEESHLWIHSLLGGRIDPSATTLEAFFDAARETRHLLEMTTPSLGEDADGMVDTTASPPRAAHQAVDEEAAGRALRHFLSEKLPDYMIPSNFTLLDNMPLTANGKVDRAALPKLHQVREKPQGPAYVEPKSEVERQIAALWQETLHTERVGLHDNFFDLGGNSVLMVRVYNKLRETLGREFPLVTLFEHPTIHFLAAFFSEEQPANSALNRGFDRGARRKKRRRK